MIPILILAGGSSSRMGGADKLLEPVGGVPLLRHVVEEALATGHAVSVALPIGAEARRATLVGLEVAVHEIAAAAEGMGGTLREVVHALPRCPAFLVMLADLPELTGGDMASVIAARGTHPEALIWRGATANGKPGHPILFDTALRSEFAELSGDRGAATLVARHSERVHLVRLDGARARTDLDTPEDWAAWRASRPNG